MEGLQMWRVERSGAAADKSRGSHTLTGRIETPQILRALLNFREMKVGGGESSSRDGAPASSAKVNQYRHRRLITFSRISHPVRGSEPFEQLFEVKHTQFICIYVLFLLSATVRQLLSVDKLM